MVALASATVALLEREFSQKLFSTFLDRAVFGSGDLIQP